MRRIHLSVPSGVSIIIRPLQRRQSDIESVVRAHLDIEAVRSQVKAKLSIYPGRLMTTLTILKERASEADVGRIDELKAAYEGRRAKARFLVQAGEKRIQDSCDLDYLGVTHDVYEMALDEAEQMERELDSLKHLVKELTCPSR